ncbi:hypothetical protein [Clostridium estertheticum]|uniref:hypothetical protein n=1 Tax=Clostridium estertheticum TaxID=238834 RepID=UPI0014785B79|nr:hypothetical protein [Clostridium estertheticum]MBZ9615313.1 hypothetical protein [Clostridium estertheticum subsp. laramiense]WAG75202.1 hypothetical protein LL032_07055 [Clostridium estertheticum]
MARIDFKDMYLGRIDQLNIDIKVAINRKDWKTLAKLEAKKKINQDFIKKLE